jgi:O-antigen/teichoic acid export membrane protein
MRRLLSLAGGAAAGQAITVLASPIISRHYGPAEIGAFSVFTTTALLLNSTNSLRYEMAVPVAQDEDSAGHLVWLCFLLVTGFSALLGVGVLLWGGAFCRLVKVPTLAPLLWVLPVTTAVAGFYEPLNFHAIRRNDFRSLAQARVVQGAVQSGIQVGLGFFGGGTAALVGGDLAARVLSTLRLVRGGPVTGIFRRFPWSGIRRAGVEFARYPMFMAGASILNLTAIQIPFLIIPSYFGSASAGFYFLAYRTLFVPASFIGGAISQVFLGEAAARAREGEDLQLITTRVFLVLAAAYLPIYTVCFAAAGQLFPLVFGPRWAQAGTIAQVLAPMTLVWSLARPLAGLLMVRDRLKESLGFTVFELAAVLTALQIGHHLGSINRAAVYIAGAGLLTSGSAVLRFVHAAGVHIGHLLARFAILVAIHLPLGLGLWALARHPRPWLLLAASVAGAAVTALGSYRFLRRERLV